jgi:hypothetical protein
MAVFLNGIAQLEYDREKLLPDHQTAYLDKMDSRMETGIQIGEEVIKNPDLNQRAQFAATNMVHAIKSNDESTAAAMCSYLAIRLPRLKQVKIEEKDGIASIEFIYDEAYRKQVVVDFPQLH